MRRLALYAVYQCIVVRCVTWHCNSEWILHMCISEVCSVFVLDEVFVRKCRFTKIGWPKQATDLQSCCAYATVLLCVIKAPEVWCSLVGLEANVILQCYDFSLHLFSIQVERCTQLLSNACCVNVHKKIVNGWHTWLKLIKVTKLVINSWRSLCMTLQ